MDLTTSERELIERLRSDKTFRLLIQRRSDGWTVTTAPAAPVNHLQNTGGGDTFAQAWEHSKDRI